MTRIHLTHRSVLAIAVAVLGSCGTDDRRRSSTGADVLAEVSPLLALMEFDLKTKVETHCLLASSFDEGTPNNAARDAASQDETARDDTDGLDIRGLIQRLKDAEGLQCDFYRLAERSTAPVFQLVRGTRRVPATAYVFALFKESDQGDRELYERTDIGLFETLGSCEQVEALARGRGVPTARCSTWEEAGLPLGLRSESGEGGSR